MSSRHRYSLVFLNYRNVNNIPRHEWSRLMQLFVLSILFRWRLYCQDAWCYVVSLLALILGHSSTAKVLLTDFLCSIYGSIFVSCLFLPLIIILIFNYYTIYTFKDFLWSNRTFFSLLLFSFERRPVRSRACMWWSDNDLVSFRLLYNTGS